MSRLHLDLTNPRLRDLVGGEIVSEPVMAEANEPVVARCTFGTLECLGDLDGGHMDECPAWDWQLAHARFPDHIFRDEDGSLYTRECCTSSAGACSIARREFVDALRTKREFAHLEGVVHEMDDDPDVDLLVDPITALASEHVRVGKVNRMRTHNRNA